MNIICKQEVKIGNQDYRGMDQADAIQDFTRRIRNYEAAYEPLDVKFDKYVAN